MPKSGPAALPGKMYRSIAPEGSSRAWKALAGAWIAVLLILVVPATLAAFVLPFLVVGHIGDAVFSVSTTQPPNVAHISVPAVAAVILVVIAALVLVGWPGRRSGRPGEGNDGTMPGEAPSTPDLPHEAPTGAPNVDPSSTP